MTRPMLEGGRVPRPALGGRVPRPALGGRVPRPMLDCSRVPRPALGGRVPRPPLDNSRVPRPALEGIEEDTFPIAPIFWKVDEVREACIEGCGGGGA